MTRFVKTNSIRAAVIAAAITLGVSSAQATTPNAEGLHCGTSIYGAWVTNEGNSVVNIFDCNDTRICGEVVKFTDNAKYNELTQETARPSTTEKGRRILDAFRAKSDNKFKGRIYNPRNGKSYKSTLKISKMGDLKVKGCLGPVCQTKIWMRPEVCTH